MIPNGFDDITGTRYAPTQSVMPTVVYRRFTPHWGRPLRTRRSPATRT
jgi:hypothetical protein